ncbi:hypothetical protein HDC37_002234 [Microbacterium sp. AK009]|uniref:hypothetical protein n=1 Tax=Microbacterium sp. AK009 TaxID=2723068 RepID=UPI00184C0584|nr:hypothetical protein [Microbacterium sp. AK009]NYF17406.1 hypothetical protein [Microbacterium sp. AK009]
MQGDPIDLVILGDSIAAGLGAERPKDTLGARAAKGLGTALKRPVRLRSVAIVGSESSALPSQIERLPPGLRPDLAVIVVGATTSPTACRGRSRSPTWPTPCAS